VEQQVYQREVTAAADKVYSLVRTDASVDEYAGQGATPLPPSAD